jgi:hypothetical protein
LTHILATPLIRERGRLIGHGIILSRYERITFHKEEINLASKPTAEFICPGHPLMDAVIDIILERYRHLLRSGAFLVDPNDTGETIRTLFYLEHSILSGSNDRRVISRQMQFVEGSPDDTNHLSGGKELTFKSAGPSPFLDYQPIEEEFSNKVNEILCNIPWLRENLENWVIDYAVQHLVPRHHHEVKNRQAEMIDRIYKAVKDRLTKEIAYWDHRAEELKAQEQAGKINARLNSEMARRRADELQGRLQRRLAELDQQRRIISQTPLVIGGALIIPAGLIARLKGEAIDPVSLFGMENKTMIEQTAMEAVLERERQNGFIPRDVSDAKLGWDVESLNPQTGKLRFIEVKGRIEGAKTITVSKNEILVGLNKLEDYFLAIVEVKFSGGKALANRIDYIQQPFKREPDFAAVSVNYELTKLLKG